MKKLVTAVFFCAVPALAMPPMQMKASVAHRDTQKAPAVRSEARSERSDKAMSHDNAVNRMGAQGAPSVPAARGVNPASM